MSWAIGIVTKENRPHRMKCGRYFYGIVDALKGLRGVRQSMFGGKHGKPGGNTGFGNQAGCGGGHRPPRPCRRDDADLFGIILVILGAVTIGAFLLPSKVWLIVLGAVMVFLGIRLVM